MSPAISQLNFKSLRVKHYFSYLLILPIALTIALINMNCDAKNETFMLCGIRHYFTALFLTDQSVTPSFTIDLFHKYRSIMIDGVKYFKKLK